MCQACRRVNRRERSPCTATRNAECGECLPGFYSKRRLDGRQDLECMPCGPTSSHEPLCSSRSGGVAAEKVWGAEIASPQPSAAATLSVSVCVALVVVVMLLSVTLTMARRWTSLRKCLKGCLLPFTSSSQEDKEITAVSTETKCILTQETQEARTSDTMLRESTLEEGSARQATEAEADGTSTTFPTMPAVLPCVPPPRLLRQSVCSDCCSSGFASLPSCPSPGLPTPPPPSLPLAASTVEPAPPILATEGHHCASEQASGPPGVGVRQWHSPVECTELDVHESFHLLDAEFQQQASSSSSSAWPRGAEAASPGGGGRDGDGDGEPSLDLYSSIQPNNAEAGGEARVCMETRRPSGPEASTVHNLLQRTCTIMQGVPLRALPVVLVRSLARRLDPVCPGVQGCQQVALCLGVPTETAAGLQGFEQVFHYLSSCTPLTVPDLLAALHRLQRLEALSLLCEHCCCATAETGGPHPAL
ncbi:tumor necrosis factor receptor superfamily member 27 [Engraulis encrasicolus]|uniref:tumor necrosis factor receptor superfamily member 27 n=1 Tax=Engraulis encrasicolus TaxID=184585 RepID=UPI002FD66E62